MTTTTLVPWLRTAARTPLVGALAMLSLSQGAWAQGRPVADWQHGSTLVGFLGTQSASSKTNAAAGVGLGWELTRHFALEGRGTWFRVNEGPSDFAATLAAHVPLMSPGLAVPFVSAGAGMYRATFDSTASGIPDFYRLRMPDGVPAASNRTFQDFLATFGGGVNVFVANHFALRPEASVMVVTTRHDSRALGVYSVQMVYHFEAHKIGG